MATVTDDARRESIKVEGGKECPSGSKVCPFRSDGERGGAGGRLGLEVCSSFEWEEGKLVLRSARPLGMDVKGSPVRLGGRVDCMNHFQLIFIISPRLRASRPPIIEPPRLECWTPPELLHALGSVLCARVDMIFAAPALTYYPNSKRPLKNT